MTLIAPANARLTAPDVHAGNEWRWLLFWTTDAGTAYTPNSIIARYQMRDGTRGSITVTAGSAMAIPGHAGKTGTLYTLSLSAAETALLLPGALLINVDYLISAASHHALGAECVVSAFAGPTRTPQAGVVTVGPQSVSSMITVLTVSVSAGASLPAAAAANRSLCSTGAGTTYTAGAHAVRVGTVTVNATMWGSLPAGDRAGAVLDLTGVTLGWDQYAFTVVSPASAVTGESAAVYAYGGGSRSSNQLSPIAAWIGAAHEGGGLWRNGVHMVLTPDINNTPRASCAQHYNAGMQYGWSMPQGWGWSVGAGAFWMRVAPAHPASASPDADAAGIYVLGDDAYLLTSTGRYRLTKVAV